MVGRDDDDSFLISIMIVLFVVAMIMCIMVYCGAFIGGYHSLKNYALAFKHNVIDSNAELEPA